MTLRSNWTCYETDRQTESEVVVIELSRDVDNHHLAVRRPSVNRPFRLISNVNTALDAHST